MGRIIVTEFVSLDGVIEDPGGSEDYRHGGWSFGIPPGPRAEAAAVGVSGVLDRLRLFPRQLWSDERRPGRARGDAPDGDGGTDLQ